MFTGFIFHNFNPQHIKCWPHRSSQCFSSQTSYLLPWHTIVNSDLVDYMYGSTPVIFYNAPQHQAKLVHVSSCLCKSRIQNIERVNITKVGS